MDAGATTRQSPTLQGMDAGELSIDVEAGRVQSAKIFSEAIGFQLQRAKDSPRACSSFTVDINGRQLFDFTAIQSTSKHTSSAISELDKSHASMR